MRRILSGAYGICERTGKRIPMQRLRAVPWTRFTKEAEEAFAEYDLRFRPSGLSEFYRGLFHQKRGEPEKAIERLQRALALDKEMVRAIYYLSLCQRDLGNEKEADAYMEKWKRVEEENKKRAMEKFQRAREKAGAAPPAGGSDPKKDEGTKDEGGK